ncbi:MAG TPA: dihydrofolate reductase family protein [Gemmatimonadaceae bacterium]|nr:dihydrofolate reductase family protein [Gemmatimonadaceae bacterium]
MPRIIAFIHLTLDGVMQAPARPDEDTRGGFRHGGWANGHDDPVMGRAVGESMATTGAILLGRRTYEDFYNVWPKRTDNPFTPVLNNTLKYVASRTLTDPLPWMNSKLLRGNAEDSVAALREESGKDIIILGSGSLVQSLLRRKLIDELMLMIHPVVLGSGRRLFAEDGTFATLKLEQATPTTKGVVITRYRLA